LTYSANILSKSVGQLQSFFGRIAADRLSENIC
jgi:hypothetical protein